MSDKFQVIRENAPMVTYVVVDAGKEGWTMRLVLFPNADLNDITFYQTPGVTYKLDQGRVARFDTDGCVWALRSDEAGWDRVTKDVPNTVLTEALEWASELKEFADANSPVLRP